MNAAATDGEIDLLVHYMGLVVRSNIPTDWERQFCASIISRSRRRGFVPTEKQTEIMRRLADRFRAETMGPQVVEGDGEGV